MIDAHEFAASWKTRIEYDLASFRDPGTTIKVTGSGRNFRAEWTTRGVVREGMFSIFLDQGVWVNIDGRRLTYRSFVSGPDLADLETVARMILQASKSHLFVATRAEHDNSENDNSMNTTPDLESGPAVDVLTNLIETENITATRVVMVTGGAGAGKTRVLQELVRRQADKYIRGQTTKLLLYVNAQGRALARLNEALATELQDLKVNLTYHSIAALARLGILIPVIDGFDELLGVSGYDDAFSSLAGFLEQLMGEGQLLASARSVYYEEEFLARAGSISTIGGQAWKSIPVRILEWGNEDQENYLNHWAEFNNLSNTDSDWIRVQERLYEIFGERNSALASKPLFFTRVVDLLWRNSDFSGGDDLLRELANEYLSRERNEKLLDKQSEPLLTDKQFERLMRELAEEMWNQETRELDYRSIRDVAEYVVEDEGLSETTKQTIIERMPTLAFLAKADSPTLQTGAFEHELFFFYFLAASIVSQLTSTQGDMRIILSRSALPEDVADRVAIELSSDGPNSRERLQELLDRLSVAGATEWRRTTQVRENAGLLVMGLFRAYADLSREIDECTVRSVVFPGSHLDKVSLTRCLLDDVTVRRTDLSSTRFLNCEARNVLFIEPYVKPGSTLLELQGLRVAQVTGIRVPGSTSYEPSAISGILRECGAPIPTDPQRLPGPYISSEYKELLGRLVRAYRRANPVCISDDNLASIFHDPRWDTLERLLVDHDLVRKETRATSGRKTAFLRRQFLPEQLMSSLNEDRSANERIRAFWKALESETRNAA